MSYTVSLNVAGSAISFDDEGDVEITGTVKDVAMMFSKHIYNSYNGYLTYTFYGCLQVNRVSDTFTFNGIMRTKKVNLFQSLSGG